SAWGCFAGSRCCCQTRSSVLLPAVLINGHKPAHNHGQRFPGYLPADPAPVLPLVPALSSAAVQPAVTSGRVPLWPRLVFARHLSVHCYLLSLCHTCRIGNVNLLSNF